MPAPTGYTSRTTSTASPYDPDSDDEDSRSTLSHSTWASTSSATILGYSDGYVGRGGAELVDWRMSRIGGAPVRFHISYQGRRFFFSLFLNTHPTSPLYWQTFPVLSIPPAVSASTCLICQHSMPLLTQIYAPIDSSPVERVVYTFACLRRSCRSKKGSIRAWRSNTRWPPEPIVVAVEEPVVSIPTKVEFDLGNLIFGAAAASSTTTQGAPAMMNNTNPFVPSSSSSSAIASNPLLTTVTKVTEKLKETNLNDKSAAAVPAEPLSTSWPAPVPAYPPQYLTTAYEPIASVSSTLPPQLLVPPSASRGHPDDDLKHREGKGAGGRVKKGATTTTTGGSNGAGEDWSKEGYEVQKVKGVDQVFLKFQERVGREGLQCVRYVHHPPSFLLSFFTFIQSLILFYTRFGNRYDHNTTPLPFSSTSAVYSLIFSSSSDSSTTTTSSPSSHDDYSTTYSPRRLPTCTYCDSPLTFEYQLMPYLVTLLNRSARMPGAHLTLTPSSTSNTAGTKGKGTTVVVAPRAGETDLERVQRGMEEDGLDFATVMIFTCAKECVDGLGEAWREECVLGEWEV